MPNDIDDKKNLVFGKSVHNRKAEHIQRIERQCQSHNFYDISVIMNRRKQKVVDSICIVIAYKRNEHRGYKSKIISRGQCLTQF